ncbi:TULIP family P47-like protein [Bacillus sp. 2SH]|uniref:TULIP family P47-like protein n=1 Tax=Bacillus sp. 2SH TaxID=2502202 RepID=UPI001BB2C168|nr:TULIP family P47-like protein [Bacillus sp. 2SH]
MGTRNSTSTNDDNCVISNLLKEYLNKKSNTHNFKLGVFKHTMDTVKIDLFGYDTAFGISFTKVNEAIKKKKVTPSNFLHSVSYANGATIRELKGEWDDWKLSTNSSDNVISLICPIKSGHYTYKHKTESALCDIKGKWVKIELKLEYLNQDKATYVDQTTSKEHPGQQVNLVPKLKSDDSTDPIVLVKSISPDMLANPNVPNVIDPDDESVYIKSYFEHWFLENIKKFEHIFAIFIINQEAKNPEYQWLKPKKVSYAVTAKNNDESGSILGVMAITDVENKEGTAYHQIDHRILDSSKGNAAYAIQSKLLVKNWILKGLVNAKLGEASDFKVIENGLGYTNTKKIVWKDFKDENDNRVTAYIDEGKFSVAIVNNEIRMEFLDIHWEHSEGIIVHVNYTDYYTLKLKSGVDQGGKAYKNILTAVPTQPPTLHMSYSVEDWKRNKNLIISITVGVAGSIIGALFGAGVGAVIEKAFTKGAEEGIINVGTAEARVSLPRIPLQEGDEIPLFNLTELADTELSFDLNQTSATFGASRSNYKIGQIISYIRGNFIGGVIGAILGGSLGILTHTIMEHMGKDDFSKVPTLDNFAANCVESVKWPNESGFELTDAKLVNGGFILNGNIKEG